MACSTFISTRFSSVFNEPYKYQKAPATGGGGYFGYIPGSRPVKPSKSSGKSSAKSKGADIADLWDIGEDLMADWRKGLEDVNYPEKYIKGQIRQAKAALASKVSPGEKGLSPADIALFNEEGSDYGSELDRGQPGFNTNINPLQRPDKIVKDMAVSFKKNLLADIDNYTEPRTLRRVLSPGSDTAVLDGDFNLKSLFTDPGRTLDNFEKKTEEWAVKSYYNGFGRYAAVGALSASDEALSLAPGMQDVREKTITFFKQKDNPNSRRKAYIDANLAVQDAGLRNIKMQVVAARNGVDLSHSGVALAADAIDIMSTDGGDAVIDWLQSSKGYSVDQAQDALAEMRSMQAEINIVTEVQDLGKAIDAANTGIGRTRFIDMSAPDAAQKLKKEVDAPFDKLATKLEAHQGVIGGNPDESYFAQQLAHIQDPDRKRAFKKQLDEFEAKKGRGIANFLERNKLAKIETDASGRRVVSRAGAFKYESLAGTGRLGQSAQAPGRFWKENTLSKLSSGVNGTRSIGTRNGIFASSYTSRLLKESLSDVTGGGVNSRSRLFTDLVTSGETLNAITRLTDDRLSNEYFTEIFRFLETGSLDDYLFKRVDSMLGAYSPAKIVERLVARTHNYGLVVQEDHLKHIRGSTYLYGSERIGWGIGRIADKDGGPSGTLGNIYANKAKLNVNGKKVKVWGGSHFDFIDNLSQGVSADGMNMEALELLFTFGADDVDGAWNQLLGDPNNTSHKFILEKMLGLKSTEGLSGDDLAKVKAFNDARKDQLETLLKQKEKFEKWLKKNAKRLNIDPKALGNVKYLATFAGAAHKYHSDLRRMGVQKLAGLTKKFAGPQEKLTKILNIFQYKIMQNRYVKWIINPVYNLRQVIYNRFLGASLKLAIKSTVTKWAKKILSTKVISAILSQITVKSIDAITAGLGAIVAEVLEPIIRYVINKTLDVGVAIIKLRFDKIYDMFIGSAEKNAKAVLYVVMMFAAAMATVGNSGGETIERVTDGTSPVETTYLPGEYINAGGNYSGSARKACEEETVTPNNCFFKPGEPRNRIWGSYNSSGEASNPDPTQQFTGGNGHGSNAYWNAVSGGDRGGMCVYALPGSPNGVPYSYGEQNYCYVEGTIATTRTPNPAQRYTASHYGFASDEQTFQTDSTGELCGTVYLPTYRGNNVSWQMPNSRYGSGVNGFGVGIIGTYNDGGVTRTIHMNVSHLGSQGMRLGMALQSGDAFGQLFEWQIGTLDNTHLHIEIFEQQGGSWVAQRPEEVFCN